MRRQIIQHFRKSKSPTSPILQLPQLLTSTFFLCVPSPNLPNREDFCYISFDFFFGSSFWSKVLVIDLWRLKSPYKVKYFRKKGLSILYRITLYLNLLCFCPILSAKIVHFHLICGLDLVNLDLTRKAYMWGVNVTNLSYKEKKPSNDLLAW